MLFRWVNAEGAVKAVLSAHQMVLATRLASMLTELAPFLREPSPDSPPQVTREFIFITPHQHRYSPPVCAALLFYAYTGTLLPLLHELSTTRSLLTGPSPAAGSDREAELAPRVGRARRIDSVLGEVHELAVQWSHDHLADATQVRGLCLHAAVAPPNDGMALHPFINDKAADVVMTTPEGESVRAHRWLLATRSAFWGDYFANGGPLTLTLPPSTRQDSLLLALTFIYTDGLGGDLPVTDEVPELLCGAIALGVLWKLPALSAFCERLIISTHHIPPSAAHEVARFAKAHGLIRLYSHAVQQNTSDSSSNNPECVMM